MQVRTTSTAFSKLGFGVFQGGFAALKHPKTFFSPALGRGYPGSLKNLRYLQ